MEPGLYLTFFTAGEPYEKDLPEIGPFDNLVVRQGSLVADRRSVSHPGDIGGRRWIEAELELQRALGNEPGGVRRPDLRIAAPQGVYLRFDSFGSPTGGDPVPELGPYAVVVVSRRQVEADRDVLASRPETAKDRSWVLTAGGGSALAGIVRPDIAFRTRSTNYHPGIHPARLMVRPAERSVRPTPSPRLAVPPTPVEVTPPASRVVPDLVPDAAQTQSARSTPPPAIDDRDSDDSVITPLRARFGGSLRTTDTPTPTRTSRDELSRAPARRWARFLVLGVLVTGLALVGAIALRGALSNTSGNAVGIGKPVTGTQWDYTVATVSRVPQVSAASARGVYLIVFVTATNRGGDRAALAPTSFRLIDSRGVQYSPLSESDPVYRSDSNPGSPLTWATSYAVGQTVSTPLVFDVDPTLRGLQLMILEVPTVRVRLD